MRKFVIATMGWSVIVGSMSAGCQLGIDMDNYVKAVKSGFSQIPEALEVEQLLGEADHFVSYSPGQSTQLWNSEVFFNGRYKLTMQVEVRLNEEFSAITEIVGEPTFYLFEYLSVNQEGIEASIGENNNFGRAAWKKVVQSKGDWSVIGITVKRDQPVEHLDRFVEGLRNSRIRVRPD